MKRIPLLVTALVSTLTLVGLVGVWTHTDGSGSPLPETDSKPAFATTNPQPHSKPTLDRDRFLARHAPVRRVVSTEVADTAGGVAEDETRTPRADPPTNIETSNEPMLLEADRVPVSRVARTIPRWVMHPQAQIRFTAKPAANGPSATLARHPAVENAPPISIEPVETGGEKAKVISDSVRVSTTNSDAAQTDDTRPSRWPSGPFTREEELYRAQYGWEAFSEELRKAALLPEEP